MSAPQPQAGSTAEAHVTGRFPQAAALTYEQIEAGQMFELERVFSQDDLLAFAAVSGDYSPLHVDPEYASGTEFGACVVHGLLLASLFSQLVGMRIPGKSALYLGQDLTFRRPVRVGESIRAIARVTGKNEATRSITLTTEIRDAGNKVAAAGTARVKVRGDLESNVATVSQPARAGPRPNAGSRVAVITGGSGGLGAEIAATLAAKGYSVAVNYHHNQERAASVVSGIEAAGGHAIAIRCDVRKRGEIEAAVTAIAEQLGPPTLLVNAAIGEIAQKPFNELSWSDFQEHLEYQVKAVCEMCQAVYPHMKAAGGGAVVNILSQVVEGQPPSKMADYVSAKWALAGLSRALAVEWAEDHIRVNAVSPGLVPTALTQYYQDRVFRMEAARTPLKRLATPRDVAAAVAYLGGTDAEFLTGMNLFVTGGQVMI